MSGKQPAPELWSDFDGTAVEILPLFHPRNWIKFPLGIMPGYSDFLEGVQRTGVAIGGIISKRPSIIRYWPTLFTIRSHELDKFFPGERIILSGSNRAKGRFIASRALNTRIGLLEDKPHKLLKPLVVALRSQSAISLNTYPILLGVVHHPKADKYLRTALAQLKDLQCKIRQTSPSTWEVSINRPDTPIITITALGPYSQPQGRDFAQVLKALE